MIIDPENQNNNNNMNPDPNEFVDSSFMVSFKANENSSVSDKIKESENSSNNSGFDEFDEFENFDYDASKSAFKPLDKPVTVEPSAPVAPVEPPKASEKTDFEQVAPVDDPAFADANVDFKEFTGVKEDPSINKSLFESGQDLDFATSSESNSSFAGGVDDEFKLDEEAMAINPFKPKNADRIPPVPAMPKAARVPDPALKPKPATVAEEVKEETKEAANIKTYGKVSSGVDAFKKPAKKEEEVKPVNEAPKKAAGSPFVKNEPSIAKTEVAPVAAPAPKSAPEAASPFIEVPKEAVPAAKPEEQSPFVKKGAPAPVKRPTSNVAKVTASNKPVADAPATERKAPRGHEPMRLQPDIPDEKEAGSRPGTSHTPSHHKAEIEPVTQVKTKSKKRSKPAKSSKDPSKGGIFGLIGVLAAIFVVLWVLDNYQTWFGKTADTHTTQVTAVTTTTDVAPAETSAVIEETEAAVVTTEATEATRTTAATETEPAETTEATEETTETTEATTTTTTEQTTTTTTEEETTTTTTRSSSNNSPVRCSYTITNPRVTSDGFVFDLAVTNNGDDLNISRLNEFTISFNTSSTITNLTSDYFNFTSDGNNSFTATPRSGSLPAGETTNITITGTTENHVQHFYINTYHFDWN